MTMRVVSACVALTRFAVQVISAAKGQNSVADNNDSLRFQAIIRYTLGGSAPAGLRMQIQMIGQPFPQRQTPRGWEG
jgi:hypothetical protein